MASKAVLAKETREEDDRMSDQQGDILQDGFEAEMIICSYYVCLISCMNTVGKECCQKPLIHPCKKTFEEFLKDLLQDYSDIVYSVHSDSKCNSAYCLRVDKNETQYCRFHYPFDESPVTYIKYNKVSNKARVEGKHKYAGRKDITGGLRNFFSCSD